jgi:large subunit ribosomal protein L23
MALFGKKKEAKPEAAENSKVEVAKATSTKKEVAKVSKAKETKVVSKAKSAPNKSKGKKEKTPFHVKKKKVRRHTTKTNHMNDLSKVLIRPRITEKATDVTVNKTYVFEVAVDATKKDVYHAVVHYYKVKPRKVNLIKIPTKKRVNRRTRKVGVSSQGKKAYVFLKDGDTIEFV